MDAKGNLEQIPYYVATISGDKPNGDEFFVEMQYVASDRSSARKKAIQLMEDYVMQHPRLDVFEVSIGQHCKQHEFQRDLDIIEIIPYDN